MTNNTLLKRLRYLISGVVSYEKTGFKPNATQITDNLMACLPPFIESECQKRETAARLDESKLGRTDGNEQEYEAKKLANFLWSHPAFTLFLKEKLDYDDAVHIARHVLTHYTPKKEPRDV